MKTEHTDPDRATLTELAGGIHAWVQPDGSWFINNAGAIADERGIVLVDTCATAARTRRFLDAVDEANASAPIRYAVNTHLHGDHTNGNALLPESAVVIGHTATREAMLREALHDRLHEVWDPAPDWGISSYRAPDLALHGDLTLHTGRHRVELQHPGHPAHSPGDVIAWVADEGVLFAGDLLFHGVTPLVISGSVEGALRSLDWLAGFPVTSVVPGHGPVISGSAFARVLEDHARYYRFVLDTARRARADGLDPLQAARDAELGEFEHWPDQERLVLNLHRAFADADDTDPDPDQAFGDAMEFNGGRLSCGA
ncbi:MBL fold metallo-hydrolase [Saccharopolyspora montiporae]|uniref:MBL fold metallo-hydrolase n=1 Tax=Saccharopolyspora montiporae TaxID=2781240 RepID=UPI00351C57FE